jgi:curved DNA-binding protein CbpA
MIDPLPDDPYKALGVTKDCTVNDVKKAYRKLVLTCHPDKTGSLPAAMKKEKDEQFHNVQTAHDLLTNPHERQRYDERVQLEELRSELRRDLGREGPPTPSFKASYAHKQPRSAPNKTPAKSPTTPIFEPRGPPIYETRVPKGVFDEDFTGGRYDGPRGSSRKHEDRFPDTPPANPRRTTSGRMPDRVTDDARRPQRREDDEDFYARKAREKETKQEQRATYLDRKKTRTKTRRNESESKRQAFVESESDDSDVERFMGSSPRMTDFRRQSDEPIRKTRGEERNTRRTRSPSSDSSGDSRVRIAMDHIRNNRRAMGETPHEKRPSLSKSRSSRTPPPPPPIPPVPPVDNEKGRRSSARRPTSSKSKRNPEIVEPSKDFHEDYTFEFPRRPKKEEPTSVPSSPRNITSSARAKTFTPDRSGDSAPSIRRTQTMPTTSNGVTAGRPSRSSNLKYATTPTGDEEDSGYSSPGSPNEPPPSARFTSKKYRVKEDSDSDSDPRKPRIMTVELDDTPKSAPPRSARAPISASATAGTNGPSYVEAAPRSHAHRARGSGDVRSPPRRSNTFDLGASSASKNAASKSRHHHSSSNDPGANSGRLFGELGNDGMFVPPDVSFSPKYGKDDIQYAEVRRGSADGAIPSRGDRERSERERSREKERDRERGDRDRDRERERPHREHSHRDHRDRGKDDYAYEPRSARRAAAATPADRPGLSGRGGSYQSVRV